jgi:hypothetical protein
MIELDALYFLLLIECIVVLAAVALYFVLRSRKYAALYRSVESGVQGDHTAPEEPPVQQAAAPPPAGHGVPSAEMQASGTREKELEESRAKVSVLEEEVKENTGALKDLQAKFDDLEKEYLILYHQQQAQEKKQD